MMVMLSIKAYVKEHVNNDFSSVVTFLKQGCVVSSNCNCLTAGRGGSAQAFEFLIDNTSLPRH